MVYDHIIKQNGIYYRSGEEVPDAAEEASPLPFSDENIEFETDQEKRYTKSEINRMPIAELQNLAAEVGMEKAFETSGAQLKKNLIEYFKTGTSMPL